MISWEIIQLLLRINELGVTILMATHDAEIVTALRRRVVALEDGRIIRTRPAPRTTERIEDVIPFVAFSLAGPGRGSGATR